MDNTATVLDPSHRSEGIKDASICKPTGIRQDWTVVAAAAEALKNNAIPVANKEAIAQVAAVSSRLWKSGWIHLEAMESW